MKFSDVENGSYLNTDAEYPTTTTQTGHAFKENDIKCDGYNTQRFQDTACVSCMQENGVDNIYQETQMKEVPIIYVFLQKCSNRSPTHIACTGREGGELWKKPSWIRWTVVYSQRVYVKKKDLEDPEEENCSNFAVWGQWCKVEFPSLPLNRSRYKIHSIFFLLKDKNRISTI